jgi:hypothetical protein
VKIIEKSLSQHDEKHVVPTPLSVGKDGRRSDSRGKIVHSMHNIVEKNFSINSLLE